MDETYRIYGVLINYCVYNSVYPGTIRTVYLSMNSCNQGATEITISLSRTGILTHFTI